MATNSLRDPKYSNIANLDTQECNKLEIQRCTSRVGIRFSSSLGCKDYYQHQLEAINYQFKFKLPQTLFGGFPSLISTIRF